MDPLHPPAKSNDIYALSDEDLADRLQFIKEIGFGNWGSVWLCRPRSRRSSKSSPNKYQNSKLAVKLVHRSKTPTTAARVRSLWNEMKIVRSFKYDPHPSIIPFYSFVITPSYALITMDFLPRLVPVEVDEPIAKRWFKALLSGVEFLHKRGVVHNDIKPANILLSEEDAPVLVDFGFAEKYNKNSTKAFKSNLAYGTPEYLSPERARGLYHDTRKSDVWSLGITFFEIIIGRTPFEYARGEKMSTKEDLENYWTRTLRGKWVGSWKMSRSVEKMLRRMIAPNADVRCTASDAMDDPYWTSKEAVRSAHRKSTSLSQAAFSAINIDVDASKLFDIVSPFTTRTLKDKKEHTDKHNKENIVSPQANRRVANSSAREKQEPVSILASRANHSRSQSQPKVQLSGAQNRANSQTPKPSGLKPLVFAPLAPIKGSTTSSVNVTPVVKRTSAIGKENVTSPASQRQLMRVASDSRTRKPVGPRKAPITPDRKKPTKVKYSENVDIENATVAKPKGKQDKRGRVLKDVSINSNVNSPLSMEDDEDISALNSSRGKGSVKERWLDWERERERLREMDRMEEQIKEAEEEKEKMRKEEEEKEKVKKQEEVVDAVLESVREEQEKEIEKTETVEFESPRLESGLATLSPGLDSRIDLVGRNGLPRPRVFESGLNVLKQSLLSSIDKGVHLYKTSALAYTGRRSTNALSGEVGGDLSRQDTSSRESWEDEFLIREANSSLPAVRHAVRNERLARDSNMDRMTIWIQNVEKVVEEARRDFAAAPPSSAPLPPLPVAPCRHASQRRNQRMPRKILAANEIFSDDGEVASTAGDQTKSQYATANSSFAVPDLPQTISPAIIPSSPPRARRATVSGLSPEITRNNKDSLEAGMGSPSKRAEKSRSQGDLLIQPITPLQKLEIELEKLSNPTPPLRLSALVDRSLFVASPSPSKMMMETDDLESSPYFVEPYPSKAITGSRSLDSPNTRRRVESKYEELITSAPGVKKVGLGYQSDLKGAVVNMAGPDHRGTASKRDHKLFNSTRRVMPPPISSEDWRRTVSVDELGNVVTPSTPQHGTNLSKTDRSGTTSVVRRAFNLMTGKTVSRRLSRIA